MSIQRKLIDEKLSLQELEQFLWKSADILRGPIEISEYKNYILSLLFYKRLSDVYLEEYEKNLEKYGDEKVAREKLHKFTFPEGCLWEDVRKVGQNVGAKLNEVMDKITKENPELEGVLNRTDFHDREKLSEDRVVKLVEHFSQHRLGNKNVPSDMLGQAYEYLIKQFADTAGKKGGEFYTPREVVKVLVNILSPDEGDEVYDPCCGSTGMLIEAYYYLKDRGRNPEKLFLFGQEINVFTWAIAMMNVILHNMDAELHHGDTFADPKFLEGGQLRKFDIVLANPMWNQDGYKDAMVNDRFGRFSYGVSPNSSADWGWIQHMLASLKNDGRMGIVLDNGVLFRGGSEGKIREKVIEADLVECVIALPEKLFYNTGAPGCLLILNKDKLPKRKGRTLFIYAGREFEKLKNMNKLRDEDIMSIVDSYNMFKDIEKIARVVSLEKIKENDYNLSVTRYVDIFDEEEPVDIPEVLDDLKELEGQRRKIDTRLKGYLAELEL